MSPKVQSLLLETMPKSLVQIKLNDMPLDFEDEFSPAVTRHEDYYFDDGNLVLRIENTLFRVFRSTFIRHSSTFSDLFDLPPPSQSKEVEGTTDYNPIILSGISVVDFERLLWVLYPPTYGVHKAQILEEWTSILDLATRWEFTSIRALAIRSIQALNVPPADCIALCHKYDIADGWTTTAYVALCERVDPLTITEANKLGMEAVVHVVQIRERLRAGNSLTSYGSPTRSAARRQEVIGNRSRTSVTGRSERLQWDIGKSFLDQTHITPPRHIVSSNKSIASKSSRQMPVRSARLVAEAFGLPLGSQR